MSNTNRPNGTGISMTTLHKIENQLKTGARKIYSLEEPPQYPKYVSMKMPVKHHIGFALALILSIIGLAISVSFLHTPPTAVDVFGIVIGLLGCIFNPYLWTKASRSYTVRRQ